MIKTNCNGLRKPRQARALNYDPFRTAVLNATRLTSAEISNTMAPIRACEKALREGVATSLQFAVLTSSLDIAAGIEKSRIVRGLSEHIASGQAALSAVGQRAERTGTWKQTALYHHELEAIRTAFELHEFQLQQVSAGELHQIVNRLIATTKTKGGEVRRVSAEELSRMGLHPAVSPHSPTGAQP